MSHTSYSNGIFKDFEEIANTIIGGIMWWMTDEPQAEPQEVPTIEIAVSTRPVPTGTPLIGSIGRLNSFADQGNIVSFTAIFNKIISQDPSPDTFKPDDYISKLLTNTTYGDATTVIQLATLIDVITNKYGDIPSLKLGIMEKIEYLISSLDAANITALEEATLTIDISTLLRAQNDALEMEDTYDRLTSEDYREIAGRVQDVSGGEAE